MRPEVICHIMSSVDGRLLPGRWSAPFGNVSPGELFKEYATIGRELHTDAWMFGKGTTIEIFPEKFTPATTTKAIAGSSHKARRNTGRLFITIDPEGDILFTEGTLRDDDMLVVTGSEATADYLAMLESKGISYIVAPNPSDLGAVLDTIGAEFGIRRISLQGGGIIDGAMLAANVLSELSLVIYPGIDGLAASPSIFEYIGTTTNRPAAGQTLELKSCDTRPNGIIWLRYRFHR